MQNVVQNGPGSSNNSGLGGGIWTQNDASVTTTLFNTIVSGNSLGSGENDNLAGKAPEAVSEGNLFGSSPTLDNGQSLDATKNLTGIDNPMLDMLWNNGGLAHTHAILDGSSALGAGVNAGRIGPDGLSLNVDQRGAPFVRALGGVDVGAFEQQQLKLLPPVDILNDESDGNFSVGDLSLREAIELTSANPGDDFVTFASSLAGQTLTLDSPLIISGTNGTTTILGLGRDNLTIDAQGVGRVLQVNSGVTATIDSLTFTGGIVSGDGGGISNLGTLNLNDSNVTGNQSTQSGGGGIYNNGTLNLSNSQVNSNTSGIGSAGDGGGIFNNGTMTLINSNVSGNLAPDSGGGIVNNGSLDLSNSLVSGNTASSYGGGIENTGSGTLSLANSTVSLNTVNDSGGGLNNVGTLSLTNTTISNNSARGFGGGIQNNGGAMTLTNVTIIENVADSNRNDRSTGGGIWTRNNATTFTTLYNTIVAGNSLGSGTANNLAEKAPESVSEGNLFGPSPNLANGQSLDSSKNLVNVTNPWLGNLQNNGGPTFTHALLTGSPAINAGVDACAQNPDGDPATNDALINDQRGAPLSRFIGTVDIGAVEQQPVTLVVDITTDENDGDFSEGDRSLREAIAQANANPLDNTITFALLLIGATLTLGSQLILSDSVGTTTIEGLSGNPITIDAQGNGRIFEVLANVSAEIKDLTLTGGSLNFAFGGAIYNSGQLTLTDATVTANSATGFITVGGGIYNRSGRTLNLHNSTISNSQSCFEGCGIYNLGTLNVRRSTISGNIANSSGDGGGILNDGILYIIDSTVSGNQAIRGFGGGIGNRNNASLINSTVSGNSARLSGGGVANGAGRFSNGSVNLTNVTVTDNVANTGNFSGSGGGIWTRSNLSYVTTIHNSIVSGNSLNSGANDNVAGQPPEAVSEGNLFGSFPNLDNGRSLDSTKNQVGIDDPKLGPLQDNGGPTFTHRPLADSTAIDRGVDARALDAQGVALVSDQRGGLFSRFEGPVDVGAVEVQPVILVADITADENDGNFTQGDRSLREAIALAEDLLGDNTITFAPALSGQTIGLSSALVMSDTVATTSIQGLGQNQLTIDAQGNDRVLVINSGVTVRLSDLSLTGGTTSTRGGGILNEGILSLFDSAVSGNTANDDGGGIVNYGSLSMIGTTIRRNTANVDGEGLFSRNSRLIVTESTINGNIAKNRGGGVYTSTRATLINTTISGNSANDSGGGIYHCEGVLTLTNVTITNNVANTDPSGGGTGGGIATFTDNPFITSLTLFNAIISGNSLGSGAVDNLAGQAPEAVSEGNLFGSSPNLATGQSLDAIKNQTGIDDPKLGPLQNNGGPTFTHLPNNDSPALNAGLDARAVDEQNNTLTADQRGAPFVRFNDQVDIGAVEAQSLNLVVDITNDENDGDFTQGDRSLREAVALANINPGLDTVRFDRSLSGETIALGSQISLTDTTGLTTINGLGIDALTLNAQLNSIVFSVGIGVTAEFNNFIITG